MGAVLRCIECPEIGGDTIWVNMVKAYEELPDYVKAQIADLRAKASIEHSFGAVLTPEARAKLVQEHPTAEHPVVRTHPRQARRSCSSARASPRTSSTGARRRTCATASTNHPAHRCC
jgi:taurine dioxygenase